MELWQRETLRKTQSERQKRWLRWRQLQRKRTKGYFFKINKKIKARQVWNFKLNPLTIFLTHNYKNKASYNNYKKKGWRWKEEEMEEVKKERNKQTKPGTNTTSNSVRMTTNKNVKKFNKNKNWEILVSCMNTGYGHIITVPQYNYFLLEWPVINSHWRDVLSIDDTKMSQLLLKDMLLQMKFFTILYHNQIITIFKLWI